MYNEAAEPTMAQEDLVNGQIALKHMIERFMDRYKQAGEQALIRFTKDTQEYGY